MYNLINLLIKVNKITEISKKYNKMTDILTRKLQRLITRFIGWITAFFCRILLFWV